MKEIIASIMASLFQELKLPLRWLAVVGFLLLIGLGILGYDRLTGQSYYGRLEKKISLIKELQSISNQGIDKNQELYQIYLGTVEELSHGDVFNLTLPYLQIQNFSDPIVILKAISGALLWLFVLPFGVSAAFKQEGKISGTAVAVAVLAVIVAFAVVFAWLGAVIPDILTPWVNVIFYPIIQFTIAYRLTKKKPSITQQQGVSI